MCFGNAILQICQPAECGVRSADCGIRKLQAEPRADNVPNLFRDTFLHFLALVFGFGARRKNGLRKWGKKQPRIKHGFSAIEIRTGTSRKDAKARRCEDFATDGKRGTGFLATDFTELRMGISRGEREDSG